jgi:hypothetical protein
MCKEILLLQKKVFANIVFSRSKNGGYTGNIGLVYYRRR